ncbi:MAG: LysM peptidoglycan-binding domain-containing protein, partial [Candidatus Binataceae bacterium]
MAIGTASLINSAPHRDLDAGRSDKLERENFGAAPDAGEPPMRSITFVTGQTPLDVARRYGIPLVDLMRLNPHIVGLKKFGPHISIRIPNWSESRSSTTDGSVTRSAQPVVGDTKPPKHTIRRGQTFFVIAEFYKKTYGIKPIDLWLANPQLKNIHRLREGETLVIPESPTRNNTQVLKTTRAADHPTGDSATRSAQPVVGDTRPTKHTVRLGQTFNEIALFYKKSYGIKPVDLWLANPQLKNIHRLREGESLSIPESPTRNTQVLKTTRAVGHPMPPLPAALIAAAIAARDAAPPKPGGSSTLNPLPEPIPRMLLPVRRVF